MCGMKKKFVYQWFTDPVMQQYVDFKGRATRQEYWMYVLVYIVLVGILLQALVVAVFGNHAANNVGMLTDIAFLLPSLGIAVRRLHDTGKSAWWLLIGLVPIAGWIALIVFLAQKSDPAENPYGKVRHAGHDTQHQAA